MMLNRKFWYTNIINGALQIESSGTLYANIINGAC